MGALDQLRERIQDHAVEVATRAIDLTVQRTKDATSRRTGATEAGISGAQPVLNDTWVTTEIVSAEPSSKWQDEGTGIYGPTGMRIRPLRAKALRFDSPILGIVFATSVAGSPGKHFFHEPMPDRWREALAESLGR